MLPISSTNNIINRTTRNVENLCYFCSLNSLFGKLSNFSNFVWVKFRKIMAFSYVLVVKTKLPSVGMIVFSRYPFKVVNSIIKSFPVDMIDLSKFLRIGNIVKSYKSMNKKLLATLVFVKHNHLVTIPYKPSFKKFTFLMSVIRERPYSPAFCNRIKIFVTFDIFHSNYRMNSNTINDIKLFQSSQLNLLTT